MGKLNWFVGGIVTGLTIAAISKELEQPPEQRTWKGTVAGVPYNFRLNQWGDIAREYWNPESDQIVTPHALGMGWGVNFAAVSQRVQQLIESRDGQPAPEPVER
jgi:hypothetical protein